MDSSLIKLMFYFCYCYFEWSSQCYWDDRRKRGISPLLSCNISQISVWNFLCYPAGAQSAPAGPKGLKVPKGPFGPLGQLARFAAGCYIEMATSPPLAHEYELVSGWKRIFGGNRAVYESIRKIPMGETTKISVPLQALIRFSRRLPETVRFGRL